MENNDDILLTKFFDSQRQDIADDGFSKMVMQRIPRQSARPYIIWRLICVVAGIILFFLADGIDTLRSVVVNSVVNMASYILSIDLSVISPLMIYAILFAICSGSICAVAVNTK